MGGAYGPLKPFPKASTIPQVGGMPLGPCDHRVVPLRGNGPLQVLVVGHDPPLLELLLQVICHSGQFQQLGIQ